MDLTALARTVLIDRLVALENAASHATAMAAVADACASPSRPARRPLPSQVRDMDDCSWRRACLLRRACLPRGVDQGYILRIRVHMRSVRNFHSVRQ
jgi:hypothetical protein